jgi:hypothetical protein
VPDDLPLLPEQPSTSDNLRRFGPASIITVVALLFILQNTESVRFNLLWFDFRWPVWGGGAPPPRARRSHDD